MQQDQQAPQEMPAQCLAHQVVPGYLVHLVALAPQALVGFLELVGIVVLAD